MAVQSPQGSLLTGALGRVGVYSHSSGNEPGVPASVLSTQSPVLFLLEALCMKLFCSLKTILSHCTVVLKLS